MEIIVNFLFSHERNHTFRWIWVSKLPVDPERWLVLNVCEPIGGRVAREISYWLLMESNLIAIINL